MKVMSQVMLFDLPDRATRRTHGTLWWLHCVAVPSFVTVSVEHGVLMACAPVLTSFLPGRLIAELLQVCS
jgi:hypothetical protein